jgi:lipoate-protein ligase A
MPTESGILSADYKVPGGKLLRVRLHASREAGVAVIDDIAITGDFFMHPEEAIEDLEKRLEGTPLIAEAVHTKVQAFFDSGVEVVGAGVDDVVAVILAAR